MYYFSETSETHLVTCHAALRLIARTVIQSCDFTVVWGHRGKDIQRALYNQGRETLGIIVTNTDWPDSTHNTIPSIAYDLAPYPINYNDKKRFYYLAGMVMEAASLLDIELIWGGNWDGDMDFSDQTLYDLGHFQLKDVNLDEENYLTNSADISSIKAL